MLYVQLKNGCTTEMDIMDAHYLCCQIQNYAGREMISRCIRHYNNNENTIRF